MLAKILIPAALATRSSASRRHDRHGASEYNDGLKRREGDPRRQDHAVDGRRAQEAALRHRHASSTRRRPRSNFRPDSALDKQLQAMVAQARGQERARATARSRTRSTPRRRVRSSSFYSGVTELKSMVDEHVKCATLRRHAFAKRARRAPRARCKDDRQRALAGQFRYAVYWSRRRPTPTRSTSARSSSSSVRRYCGGKVATSGKCAEGESPSSVRVPHRAGRHAEPRATSRRRPATRCRRRSS